MEGSNNPQVITTDPSRVKMTSRRFCIFLVAASSLLPWHVSHALSQHFYVRVFVSNNTSRDLTFCLEDKSYCETVKVGNNLSTVGTDAKDSDRKLAQWLSRWRFDICGKSLALDQLRAVPAFDKTDDGEDVAYRTKITDRDLAPFCDGMSGSTSPLPVTPAGQN